VKIIPFISNCGEFAIIKIGVVYFFPNTNIFKSIPIPQLVSYDGINRDRRREPPNFLSKFFIFGKALEHVRSIYRV